MSKPAVYLFILILLTIILDYFLVSKWAVYKRRLKEQPEKRNTEVLRQVFLMKIIEGNRLQVSPPAGKLSSFFRYQPWDVPLGLILFTIGVFLCAWFWIFPEKENNSQMPSINLFTQ